METSEKASLENNAFVRYVHKMRDAVDAALMGAFALPVPSGEKKYLYRPLEDFLATGGKRTRPVLVCLAAEAFGKNPQEVLQIAASLEFFQAAALIHDDIADNSLTRRGEKCLYLKEGTGMALNQGDFALIESYSCVIEDETIPPTLKTALLREIALMQRHTAEGQALDLGWVRDKNWEVTPQDYLRMATLKTAWYSVASPLVLGALFAEATSEQIANLRSFGLDLGVAFQITDDILNLKGDPKMQGKDFQSDITEGKRTLLSTYALQNLEGQDKQELLGILSQNSTDSEKLTRAVELIEKAGAFEYANQIKEDLLEKAKISLASLGFTGKNAEEQDAQNALESLASFVVERTF